MTHETFVCDRGKDGHGANQRRYRLGSPSIVSACVGMSVTHPVFWRVQVGRHIGRCARRFLPTERGGVVKKRMFGGQTCLCLHVPFARFHNDRNAHRRWRSGQICTFVKRCSSGEINCVFLESDGGLGKSELVAAFTNDPGIKRECHTVLKTATGENVSIKGRDTHVVKMQVGPEEEFATQAPVD